MQKAKSSLNAPIWTRCIGNVPNISNDVPCHIGTFHTCSNVLWNEGTSETGVETSSRDEFPCNYGKYIMQNAHNKYNSAC